MQRHELARDGKTKTKTDAWPLTVRKIFAANEWVADRRQVFGQDTDPLILHSQHHPIVIAA